MKELNMNLDLVFVDPALNGLSSMLEALTEAQNKIKVVEVPRIGDDLPG